MQVANPSLDDTSNSTSSVPAVDSFGHKAWKTTPQLKVGVWDPDRHEVRVVSIDTKEMGQRCHELDQGIRAVDLEPPKAENETLRPVDRDGKRRPMQPGELACDAIVAVPLEPCWYVPFMVMPNMNGNGSLFDRWESLVLELVKQHGSAPIEDLSRAHQVLPHPGTKAFGMDLHLQVQRCLADCLRAEWEGTSPTTTWLDLYTETIRTIVQPFMAQHYKSTKFYVQKHPMNLRLQMPGMKSVQHWHCDRMFAHPAGEVNFSLCLTEFQETAGICLELLTTNGERQVFPILAGAGSIVVAPFGYCPHGNLVNRETPEHTRVSIDWRVITVEDMEKAEDLGASATSGLLYAPGAYYGLWDASCSNWVQGPNSPRDQSSQHERPASE